MEKVVIQTAEELFEHYKSVRERLWFKEKPAIEEKNKLEEPVQDIDVPIPKFINGEFKRLYISEKTRILKNALRKNGMTMEELFSYNRSPKYQTPRRAVWYEMREAGYSLKQIGAICRPWNPYDHTTILHGIRNYKKKLKEDEDGKVSQS